jgi:hypothetical protein
LNPVATVAAGGLHTVALLADGSVACWGYNLSGQCDVPSAIGTPANPVASVAAGGSITVAVLGGPVAKPCPADLTGNGVVDGADLGRLFFYWGQCGDCRADLDEDGVVGGSDLGLLFIEWGACP